MESSKECGFCNTRDLCFVIKGIVTDQDGELLISRPVTVSRLKMILDSVREDAEVRINAVSLDKIELIEYKENENILVIS